MPEWQFWVLLSLDFIIVGSVYIARGLIKAWIEQGVRASFETSLENLRSDLRRSEETWKADLRLKEMELAALRDGVLSSRTQRQALLDKRMIDAVERVWMGINALAPFKGVSAMMAPLKFDAAAKLSAIDPRMRQFFQIISQMGLPKDINEFKNPAKDEQPFMSALAWAYFSAYEMVVQIGYFRAKLLETGVSDARKLMDDTKLKAALKAALPHHEKYIDDNDASAYYYLLEELETRLMIELQRMLKGEEQDDESVKRGAQITQAVHAAIEGAQQSVSPTI